MNFSEPEIRFMKMALRLAKRGAGNVSPNPMVGAVLVKKGRAVGKGWHRRAGLPHAEVEALEDAKKQGASPRGASLFVTLEPCSTQGRTGACCDSIIEAGIKEVVCGAVDPNPRHAGRGFQLLRQKGIRVRTGALGESCQQLNEAFNHWITQRLPFVTVKAAMTLDGKIATRSGQSKWITGEKARAQGMRLRFESDAILAGIETVLADDPELTVRAPGRTKSASFRRIVLDSKARTPLEARLLRSQSSSSALIVVGSNAPAKRVLALEKMAAVWKAPLDSSGQIDLRWLLKELGGHSVASLLVEGGGEVNASFLLNRLAQKICFFYAPKIIGGRDSRSSVGGAAGLPLNEALQLRRLKWTALGEDRMLTAYAGASNQA